MNVYLLGAANPETIRMIRAVQTSSPNVKFKGMLDNDSEKHGTDFYNIPVLGGIELVSTLKNENTFFVNLITGSTRIRHETTEQIINRGGKLCNFVHPNINLTMVTLGVGLYLQENVVLQAEVEVGDNTSIHMAAVVGHESKIGKSVFIAHAVSISGCCTVGDGTFIGTNATILPRVNIGQWATIGAGAVVTKDIPDFAVAVGNPAKCIKRTTKDNT